MKSSNDEKVLHFSDSTKREDVIKRFEKLFKIMPSKNQSTKKESTSR